MKCEPSVKISVFLVIWYRDIHSQVSVVMIEEIKAILPFPFYMRSRSLVSLSLHIYIGCFSFAYSLTTGETHQKQESVSVGTGYLGLFSIYIECVKAAS